MKFNFKKLALISLIRMKIYRPLKKKIFLTFVPSRLVVKKINTYHLILNLNKYTQFMMNYFEYERKNVVFFKNYIKSDDLIVEIGAHIGFFTSLFASIAKKGQIFAFEPDLDNFHSLLSNIRLNNFDNIKPFNYAIGDKDEKKRFILNLNNDGGHMVESDNVSISNFRMSDKMIEIKKLDNLKNLFSKKISILKIDAEGYEKNILIGAELLLKDKNKRPSLIMLENEDQNKLKQYFDILGLHGYKIKDINSNKLYGYDSYVKSGLKISREVFFEEE